MNKKERKQLCTLVAEWEWMQGGSQSEAAAHASCSSRLRQEFGLRDDNEDLAFARAWEISRMIKPAGDDEFDDDVFFALLDDIEEDYRKVCDRIENLDGWCDIYDYYADRAAGHPPGQG